MVHLIRSLSTEPGQGIQQALLSEFQFEESLVSSDGAHAGAFGKGDLERVEQVVATIVK